MRHKKSGRKLNRNSSHRKAMFRNMARAVLTHETIRTTEAKAKELRGVVDGLITLALKNDLHARRLAYKFLVNHQLVQHLFDVVGPRFAGGQGGYTRIIKLSQPRVGDAAPMVIFELTKLAEKKVEEAAPVAAPAAPAVEAAPVEEKPVKVKKPRAKKTDADAQA
jgi:large subunit ribosomal protein L17